MSDLDSRLRLGGEAREKGQEELEKKKGTLGLVTTPKFVTGRWISLCRFKRSWIRIPGRRKFRSIFHDDLEHITLSWTGSSYYHNEIWYNPNPPQITPPAMQPNRSPLSRHAGGCANKANSDVRYEAQITFSPPASSPPVYPGGAGAPAGATTPLGAPLNTYHIEIKFGLGGGFVPWPKGEQGLPNGYFETPSVCAEEILKRVYPQPETHKFKRPWYVCLFICLTIGATLLGSGYTSYMRVDFIREFVDEVLLAFGEYNVVASEVRVKTEKIGVLENRINETRSEIQQKENLYSQAEETISSQQSRLDALESKPRGIDEPPCWPNAEGTQPEFIYDVWVSEAGIVVKKTYPLDRSTDYGALPVPADMPSGAMSSGEFRNRFEPLFEDSVTKQCRHSVRLYDNEAEEAPGYIANRAAVEGYFYIYRP